MERMASSNNTPEGYPKWIDKYYFNDILRKDYSQFKVVRFNVAPANAKGENFASMMFRVKMTVETNSERGLDHRNFIVKVNFQTDFSQELLDMYNVFPKEIEMYTIILPQFVELYRNVGEEVRFGPTCFVGTRDPQDLIIMEDLCQEGFHITDRLAGLDFDHIQLVIAKLAKMHAASAVCIAKGDVFGTKFEGGFFAPHLRPLLESFYDQSYGILKQCISKWKYEHLMKRFYDNYKGVVLDKLFRLAKSSDGRFNVLCHGDMWSNNVMFKYGEDGGRVQECLLVDFQLSYLNSPMMDLHNLIYTSARHEVKMNKVDHILHFYYQELVANLRTLEYSKQFPTLLEFQRDFLELGLHGLHYTVGAFGMTVTPPGDDSDLETYMSAEEAGINFKRRMYTNPRFEKPLEDLLPFFERKGYFDECYEELSSLTNGSGDHSISR